MLSEISWDTFVDWIKFYQVEPFGVQTEDFRAGLVCATVANANRGKHSSPAKVSDFTPDYETAAKRASNRGRPISRESWAAWKESIKGL